MRIVLDTNVLVSGALTPFGPPGRILALIADNKLEICVDMRIVQEYRNVIFRPRLNLSRENVSGVLDAVLENAIWTTPKPLEMDLPHEADRIFIEAAESAMADALVTGNLRHYPARLKIRTPVLSPADFLSIYAKMDK